MRICRQPFGLSGEYLRIISGIGLGVRQYGNGKGAPRLSGCCLERMEPLLRALRGQKNAAAGFYFKFNSVVTRIRWSIDGNRSHSRSAGCQIGELNSRVGREDQIFGIEFGFAIPVQAKDMCR